MASAHSTIRIQILKCLNLTRNEAADTLRRSCLRPRFTMQLNVWTVAYLTAKAAV
jgi:hypothetical protein